MTNLDKQGIVKEICNILHIKIEDNFFSSGSKVTSKAIRRIYDTLVQLKPVKINLYDDSKHGLIRGIAAILGLKPKIKWFSTGSTVTAEAFNEIYNAIKKRTQIDNFDERILPISLNLKSMYDFEKEIIGKIITESEFIKYKSEIESLKDNDNKLINLIINRIEKNPYFKFISFEDGIINSAQAINEIKKKTSEIGAQIKKTEKNTIDLSYKILIKKYYKGK